MSNSLFNFSDDFVVKSLKLREDMHLLITSVRNKSIKANNM